ncbi:hypothetical protein CC78DRAFT_53208 [Lojkania enalia]|uniref:L-ornithine N(5)-monooxygenase [NAD(P)H] n=1 Tax=Lojkania enalia TaxID=147567 RepID=A0A9P4K1S3_9PLEO|nr:hypothetical protein CC78DRAFT_53208 [Didymosphaeria enalia]
MTSTEQARQLNERPTTPVSNSMPVYDLVCIGFGPAQLATAIAHRESRHSFSALFLERKPSFSWTSSSHLPRTRMENAFAFDLVTPRNPRSQFTYVNYLLKHNRLIEFANSDRLNPLRIEFDEYLQWCAAQFQEQVRYRHEVVGVFPENGSHLVECWNIAVKDASGKTYAVKAKNIVAPTPSVRGQRKSQLLTNVDFAAGQRIILADDYLSRRDEIRAIRDTRLNIALVGSSHRIIEILDDLLSCHRLGNITVITDNEALAPLKILRDQAPPQPQLCSIWAQPSCDSKSLLADSSELIQHIYGQAYEKQLASKRKYALQVVLGKSPSRVPAEASFIITEQGGMQLSSSSLFHGLDSLVLGCRQKGESLEEIQFKRGTVANGCRMWMMAANSEGGRSLAKDIALRAGDVVQTLSAAEEGQDRAMLIHARM